MADARPSQTQVDLCYLCETGDVAHAAGGDRCPVADAGQLSSHGYSWELLPSTALVDETAQVASGVLDLGGLTCRALVIEGQSGLATKTLRRLAALAAAGLRIFVMGDEQLVPLGPDDEGNFEAWSDACQTMMLEDQVSVLDHYRQLFAALRDDGLLPTNAPDAGVASERETVIGPADHTG